MRKTILFIAILVSFLFMFQGFAVAAATKEKKEEDTMAQFFKEVKRGYIYARSLYYYDKERNRVYPDVSTKRIAVSFDGQVKEEHVKYIFKKNKLLVDYYLWYDAAFDSDTMVVFQLKDEPKYEDALSNVIDALNYFNCLSVVRFASPMFIIDGKEVLFTGSFELKLKTGMSQRVLDALTKAGISMKDPDAKDLKTRECRFGFNESELNYLQVMNQFAEDFEVVYATPIFKDVNQPVTVKQTVELDGARLGGRIPYKMTITRDSKVKIDPSSLANITLMPPSELFSQHFDEYNVADIIKGTKLVVTGYVQFFSPGDYTIKKREIAYIDEKGVAKVAESKDIIVRIASLVPTDGKIGFVAATPVKEYNPPVDVKKLALVQDVKKYSAISLAAIFVLLVAVPLVKWLRRFNAQPVVDPVPGAVEGLKAALSSGKDGEEFYSKADIEIRNLLNALTGESYPGSAESVRVKLESLGQKLLAEKAFAALSVCENALSSEIYDKDVKIRLAIAVDDLISNMKK